LTADSKKPLSRLRERGPSCTAAKWTRLALRRPPFEEREQGADAVAGAALPGVVGDLVGPGRAGDVEVGPRLALGELAQEQRGGERAARAAAAVLQIGHVAADQFPVQIGRASGRG